MISSQSTQSDMRLRWVSALETAAKAIVEYVRQAWAAVSRFCRVRFGDDSKKWPRLINELATLGHLRNPLDERRHYWFL